MNTRLAALVGLVSLALLIGACTSPSDSGAAAKGAATTGSGASTPFFLPTDAPTNTSAPRIEVDAAGGIHAVYPQYVRGGAFYAYCPAGCSGAGQMKVVRFDTEGTVESAMLALDPEGHPHVLLASAVAVYYATPGSGDAATWTKTEVLRHDGAMQVTGEAFTLDPAGHPRFLAHTYKAYLGVGQKPPATHYVACDGDCTTAGSWTKTKIADQMWRSTTLRFDRSGVAKVAAAVAVDTSQYSSGTLKAAYAECAAACDDAASWIGTALLPAYENDLEAIRVAPAVSLALTKTGAPRVAFLGVTEYGKKNITYFECDEGCTGDGWRGSVLSELPELGAGLDLALDASDHPRFAHTLSYDIGLASCDASDCTTPDAPWKLTLVEDSDAMKPDQVFLYENCNVAAWFLHDPSLALDASGRARVGYQARDISGGLKNSDPSRYRDCVAGTDMTWSRLAIVR